MISMAYITQWRQIAPWPDDIEPLLAPRLKNNHSRATAQQGQIIGTEAWSLSDAVETIKNSFIHQLPR